MIVPSNRGVEWFKAKLAACNILTPYIERKWYKVARELYARVYFSARGLDIPRILVTDCNHAGISSSSSTDFVIYYYARNADESAVAFVSIRCEVMKLQSLGWLAVVNEYSGRNPFFHLRALKFIEEDPRRLPPQAPQQKRPARKAKAVHEKERQTIGTNATRTSQQDKERSLLVELEANVTVLKYRFFEEYRWMEAEITEIIRNAETHDELVKRIREMMERQKNNAHQATKDADPSETRGFILKRTREQRYIYNHCLERLLGEIVNNLSVLEQKKGKKALNAQVAKVFKLIIKNKE